MRKLFVFCVSAVVALASCSQTPAKAPGSNPEDMTSEGHEQAAQKENQEAERHEQMADNVASTKPAAQRVEEKAHERKADKHRDFAAQHEQAAESAEKTEKK